MTFLIVTGFPLRIILEGVKKACIDYAASAVLPTANVPQFSTMQRRRSINGIDAWLFCFVWIKRTFNCCSVCVPVCSVRKGGGKGAQWGGTVKTAIIFWKLLARTMWTEWKTMESLFRPKGPRRFHLLEQVNDSSYWGRRALLSKNATETLNVTWLWRLP